MTKPLDRSATPEHILELFEYDDVDLFWKERPAEWFSGPLRLQKTWNTNYAGKRVGGSINSCGYRLVKIHKSWALYHRVCWCVKKGAWPVGLIDHIDGDKLNNSWQNLREADHSLNRMNMSLRKDNTSGLYGVAFNRSNNKWVASICCRGQRRHLGSFSTFDEAASVRLAAQHEAGFGPNHGSIRDA